MILDEIMLPEYRNFSSNAVALPEQDEIAMTKACAKIALGK
jgi:hypothetical protein